MARLSGFFMIVGLLAACHHGDPPASTTPRLRPVVVPVPPAVPIASAKPVAPPVKYMSECPGKLVGIAGSGDVLAVKEFIQQNKCSGDAFDGLSHAAPLMLAAERGHLEVVQALIAAGADVDTGLSGGGGTAMVGITALWYAIKADHPDIVAELLRAGADPNHSPNHGLPLLVLAAMKETPACAKLLVEAGVSKTDTTGEGETAMTFSGGPSAEVFTYFESIGMASDGLPAAVKDSLRWEASHAPKPDAPVEERARFHAEVARTTKSRTARAFAIKHLKEDPPEIAAPTLVAIALGPAIDAYDRGPEAAIVALNAMPWTRDADKALPRLLAMMANDKRQQVRLQLITLLGSHAPVSPKLVDALIGRLERGEDRANAARALGDVIRRAGNDGISLSMRARRALERAAKGPVGANCKGADACARVRTRQAAREALAALGTP